MKYLIVLFSLVYLAKYSLAVVTTEEATKIVRAASQKCMATYPLTPDELDKLKSLKLQTTRNGQCFQACLMKKLSIMSSRNKAKKNGFIIAVALLHPKESSKQKLADRIFKSCAKISDTDECEASKKLGACIFKPRKTKG